MNYKNNYDYIKNSIFFLVSLYIQEKNFVKKNEIYQMIKYFLPCTHLSKIYIKNIINTYLTDNINININLNHDSINNLSELNNMNDSDSDSDNDFLIDYDENYNIHDYYDDYYDDYINYNNHMLNLNMKKNIENLINKINNDTW
jgi:hypothetical protein